MERDPCPTLHTHTAGKQLTQNITHRAHMCNHSGTVPRRLTFARQLHNAAVGCRPVEELSASEVCCVLQSTINISDLRRGFAVYQVHEARLTQEERTISGEKAKE